MKEFKIIYPTKRGTCQYMLTSDNLTEMLMKHYKRLGSNAIPIAIYEKTNNGKWVMHELSER